MRQVSKYAEFGFSDDAISNWVAVLRAMAVMMARGDEAVLTIEQVLDEQDGHRCFLMWMRADRLTLLHTMKRLAEIHGPPPGRRRVRELTPEGLLQARIRRQYSRRRR